MKKLPLYLLPPLLLLSSSARAWDCEAQGGLGNRAVCYVTRGVVYIVGGTVVASMLAKNAIFGEADLHWPGQPLSVALDDGTVVDAMLSKSATYRLQAGSGERAKLDCSANHWVRILEAPNKSLVCNLELNRKRKSEYTQLGQPKGYAAIQMDVLVSSTGIPDPNVLKLPSPLKVSAPRP